MKMHWKYLNKVGNPIILTASVCLIQPPHIWPVRHAMSLGKITFIIKIYISYVLICWKFFIWKDVKSFRCWTDGIGNRELILIGNWGSKRYWNRLVLSEESRFTDLEIQIDLCWLISGVVIQPLFYKSSL